MGVTEFGIDLSSQQSFMCEFVGEYKGDGYDELSFTFLSTDMLSILNNTEGGKVVLTSNSSKERQRNHTYYDYYLSFSKDYRQNTVGLITRCKYSLNKDPSEGFSLKEDTPVTNESEISYILHTISLHFDEILGLYEQATKS